MIVYIDAHTHHSDRCNPFAVRNLNLGEIDNFLKTDINEFCSAGIHPWEVHLHSTEILRKIEQALADPRIKTVGECGLDRNSKATIKEQLYFFERQVQLSETFAKPLIIHCVAAYNELINLRTKLKPTQNWVVHGFRGKPQLAKQLLNAGFAISYGEHFNAESVAVTPLDKLCIETDESEMPIEEIYKKIATIKDCRTHELNGACNLLKLYVCQ